MDGNGRWATQRGLPRLEGHRQGVEALRRAVRAAIDLKIYYLTVYSFSAENWTRPFDEVQSLLGLLHLLSEMTLLSSMQITFAFVSLASVRVLRQILLNYW